MTTPAEFSIHRVAPNAAPHTIETLQQAALQGFMETFGANYSQADVDDYCDKRLSIDAIKQELADDTAHFYLLYAQHGGQLACVGYIKYMVPGSVYLNHLPKTLTAKYKRPACLERMYILGPYQGRGLAAVAMQYVLGQLRHTHKADWVYLSVWSENYRAQRFYQRFGFSTVGSFGYPVGKAVDLELLYGLVL